MLINFVRATNDANHCTKPNRGTSLVQGYGVLYFTLLIYAHLDCFNILFVIYTLHLAARMSASELGMPVCPSSCPLDQYFPWIGGSGGVESGRVKNEPVDNSDTDRRTRS